MDYRRFAESDSRAIVELFSSTFASSEGESEGAMVGTLASDLFETTAQSDLFNFVADLDGQLVGSIFFSRLFFEEGAPAFLLAPVAVRSDQQGKGIGQALIRHGLNAIREKGVCFAVTYGDPTFYKRVGFSRISPETVRAPYKLSQPEGWLGQSLISDSIESLSGSCECVQAFRDPAYW